MLREREWWLEARAAGWATAVACGAVALESAAHTPAHQFDRIDITEWVESAGNQTIGWEFSVTSTIEITALGVYDRPFPAPEPGLGGAKLVAVWDLNETLLATAVIDAGGVLCEDDYRYADIEPLTLNAGSSYVVAAWWPSDPFDDYPEFPGSGIDPEYNPSLQFVQTRTAMSLFTFPATTDPGNEGVGVVNFRIAEGGCDPVPAPSFQTLFVGDNNFAGNMFDLEALNPAGLTVSSWQINLGDPDPQDTPVNVTVYWRNGSYQEEFDTPIDPDQWTELGTAAVVSRGVNRATPVPLGGLDLPFGQTIGVYVVLSDYVVGPPPGVPDLYYSNIPAVADPVYSNGDLQLTGGLGTGPAFDEFFIISNRMWNGGIIYGSGGNPADVNGDGTVDTEDLIEVVLSWGACPPGPCPADVDGSGEVDVDDLIAVVLGWG